MFIRYEIFPKDVKIHHEDFTLSQKEYCIFMKPVSMSMWFLQRPITSKSMSPLNDINCVNVVMEVYECADCTNRNEQRSKSKPVQQMATAMLYRAAAVQRIVLARCRFGDLNPTRCHFRYRPTHAHAHTHMCTTRLIRRCSLSPATMRDRGVRDREAAEAFDRTKSRRRPRGKSAL